MTSKHNFRSRLKIFRMLVLIIFLLITATTLILVFGYMEDSVQGRGVVGGLREYQLKSSVRSNISFIGKNEGEAVKKGDILLKLDDRDLQEKIEMMNNTICELNAEIDVKSAELEALRQDPLPKEYRNTKIALDECAVRYEKSLYEQKVFKQLYEKKVISMMEYQKKEIDHLKNAAELKTLKADYTKLQEGLARKIIARAENELQLMKRRLSSKKSELNLMQKHLSDYVFIAPEDGVISYIPNKPSGYVDIGETMVQLAASGQKKFTAYIDENQIYKVREGQNVRILSSQYNYFDYGYFDGKVYRIGELPETRAGRSYYPVKIIITKEPKPLRLGSSGEAYIIIGRERIITCITGWNK
ncbi:MAG: HlyD family efflux transporter periplasmic adaptor subunit [Victivallaceae bacterium]